MKTSANCKACARLPDELLGLVMASISILVEFRSVRSLDTIPWLSTRITFLAPYSISSLAEAILPAPAPEKTILTSPIFLPTTCSELIIDANTTIAVPCWSSWNTGIPRSWRAASISKQRGAAMSSRFIPPKVVAKFLTVCMMESLSWVARQRGKASTSARPLNKIHLPSITGIAASGPMLPNPRTAEPSVTTATVLPRLVRA